jgi:hypothetical protein
MNNNILNGFWSLVGMGVATIRLCAAVLTVLGVWIHLDSLSYLSERKYARQNQLEMSGINLADTISNLPKFVTLSARQDIGLTVRPGSDVLVKDDITIDDDEEIEYRSSPTSGERLPNNFKVNSLSSAGSEVDYDSGPIFPTDSNRLLIPLLPMGPNNQLEGFLESVFLAIKLNRTICIPPFFKHRTDELNQAISSDLRIDSKILSYLTTTCETKEIRSKCTKIETVWIGQNPINCGLALQKRYNVFNQVCGLPGWWSMNKCVPYPGTEQYPSTIPNGRFQIKNTAKEDLMSIYSDKESGKCVIWMYPFHTITNFRSAVMSHLLHRNDPGDRQLAVNVVKHVQRPQRIRDLARDFLAQRTQGRAIIVVHWRYDQQDWFVHCDKLPDGESDKSCRNVGQMLENPALAVDNFRIFLRGVRNSLKVPLAVYVAAPLDENVMSKKLLAAVGDLGELALSSIQLLPVLKQEGFETADLHDVLSTTEQEICYQAHVFLFSQISTWSFNLVYQRRVDGRSSIDNFYIFGGQAIAAATHQAIEMIGNK